MGDAVAGLARAARLEESDGGESTTVPAREMLGDLFRDAGQFGEAIAAYALALQRAPNRFNALIGAARAAEALGDDRIARLYFSRLRAQITTRADRPEVAEFALRDGR